MKTDKHFVNVLEDNLKKLGAINKPISDSAQSKISNRVKDTLRALFIDDWKYEPHYQHRNFAERRFQNVKRQTNTLLDRTCTYSYACLLVMTYFCFVLNHAYMSNIGNIRMNATDSTSDISPLLRFHF